MGEKRSLLGERRASTGGTNVGTGLDSITRHTCTCTSVNLLTAQTLYQARSFHYVAIDLSAFGLSEASLLYRVLDSLPCPFDLPSARTFRRVLRELEANPAAVRVLAHPLASVSEVQVNALFSAMEDVLDRTRSRSSYEMSLQARRAFIRTVATFANGKPLAKTGFESRFQSHRWAARDGDLPTATGASRMRPVGKSANNASIPNPVTTFQPLEFDSFAERNSKALAQKQDAERFVHSLCERTFANHREVVGLLAEAALQKRAPPSPAYLQHNFLRRPAFEQLQFVMHEIDRREAHKSGIRGINLSGLTQLHRFQVQTSTRYTAETLLSRHYLPRIVLAACAVAIMTDTAWNLETTLSLTARNVQIRNGTYRFIGIKGRTDSIQDIELDSSSPAQTDDDVPVISETAKQAVDLLLNHAAQIEKNTTLSNPPLFLSYNRKNGGNLSFGRFYFARSLAEFWLYHNVDRIKSADLRQLAAHIDYLSPNGSIFTTQALLQHKNPDTTADYLHSTLIVRLVEENSRRYMTKMAATTLYITGREEQLVKSGLSHSDIQKQLFPSTTLSEESSIADDWLKDQATKIPIGISELKHCAYQFKHYCANFENLISENPQRFIKKHLPRIIFCITLRRVILAGPHAGFYRNIEGTSS